MTDILTFTTPDYRWLSNMAYVDIEHDGIVYPSTENFYQAMKYAEGHVVFLANTLKREDIREFIATLPPTESKKFSREYQMTNDYFEGKKLYIMLTAQRKKYAQEPFKLNLLATGDVLLEEGNWWNDTFWGVDIKTRKGSNNLGKLIMQVREELRSKEKIDANI